MSVNLAQGQTGQVKTVWLIVLASQSASPHSEGPADALVHLAALTASDSMIYNLDFTYNFSFIFPFQQDKLQFAR